MNETSAMKYLEVPVDNVTLVEETNGSYHFGRVEASVVLTQMADLVNEAMEFASTEVFRHETQIVRRLEAVLHVLQETNKFASHVIHQVVRHVTSNVIGQVTSHVTGHATCRVTGHVISHATSYVTDHVAGHSLIQEIYVVPLKETYSEALSVQLMVYAGHVRSHVRSYVTGHLAHCAGKKLKLQEEIKGLARSP